YHQRVRSVLAPLIAAEAATVEYLTRSTAPLERGSVALPGV
ncbi:MAG: hypothetical protein RL033_2432, partial [Pseudomonadota bacterium]